MDTLWGDIPTWPGLAGGIVVVVLGRREHCSAQQWKRSEFLVAEVDKFFAQPRVMTALLLIDYSEILPLRDGRSSTAPTPDAFGHPLPTFK